MDTEQNAPTPNPVEKKQEFFKIMREFLPDLLTSFPEYKDGLDMGLYEILQGNDESEEAIHVYEYCKSLYPQRFFDILYQNEDIFTQPQEEQETETNTMFLPNIDFRDIWKQEITEHTKGVLWKYLQLILLTVVADIDNGVNFGDTAKLFEAINEDEFKDKIQETMEAMHDFFNQQTFNLDEDDENEGTTTDGSGVGVGHLPNPEDLHNHINGMLNGKLGQLAREIAEETANELNIDMENTSSMGDVFKKLLKNPAKLMSLVKDIGSKLDSKIKSGDISEADLIKETQEMMSKMNGIEGMPGMADIRGMMSSMGLGGSAMKGAKMNMGAAQAYMAQSMRGAQQRDRMREKLATRQEARNEVQEPTTQSQPHGVLKQENNHLVYTTGEKQEKSSIRRPTQQQMTITDFDDIQLPKTNKGEKKKKDKKDKKHKNKK